MATKDLGTYYVRVELQDGRGWIQKWDTGQRFTPENSDIAPLKALRGDPIWDDEAELFKTIIYNYDEGNGSCDCNKLDHLAYAQGQEAPEETPCGDAMPLSKLTAIRPDGSEEVIFDATVPFDGSPQDFWYNKS